MLSIYMQLLTGSVDGVWNCTFHVSYLPPHFIFYSQHSNMQNDYSLHFFLLGSKRLAVWYTIQKLGVQTQVSNSARVSVVCPRVWFFISRHPVSPQGSTHMTFKIFFCSSDIAHDIFMNTCLVPMYWPLPVNI